ncbi:RING zinc finger protein, putative [Babesia microti strain RI]|uniref:RING-type E3 ubiquitin transferase n=1 Tax=Babesia microti (strain RI) TaxID=1133968 RepID=A0A1R4ABN0_BABMR|nr:RING zinc finger protein, putative [Babesia microti strain RI]SJK86431.1 RING zinc finger protein, putative [Babesia microti strain RI]|eukprot:XP_021338589.1 RING zinc finger protein, putative [Babesia microti strain RI]
MENPVNLGTMIDLTSFSDGIVQGTNPSIMQRRPLNFNSNLHVLLSYVQVVIILSLVSFLVWFIINFQEMNKNKSFGLMELMILFWIIRSIWSILNSTWLSTFYRANNAEPVHCLRVSVMLSNVSGIAWCVAAIFIIFVNPSTDRTSYSYYICKVLFWTAIVLYLLPKVAYIILCALLHLVLYLMVRFNLDVRDLQPKTPNEIIEKLRVVSYKDVKEDILESGISGNSSRSHKAGSFNGTIAIDYEIPTCSICIVELLPDDLIIIMPCDGRHYFHKECIYSWLLRSQECPICRTNVVQFLEAGEVNGN